MKKFLSVTLSLLLAASMPLSALAETYDLAQGSITVEAKADGNQYVSQTGGVQQEQQTTDTVIHQTDSDTTSTDNTITIKAEENQTAEVTISDVNIDASGTGRYDPRLGPVEGKAAISAEGDGNVTIELEGDNTAKSGYYRAGVEKDNGGNLTIADADGDGALEAAGGEQAAGIGGGGGSSRDSSNITIAGGEIEAFGGAQAAGIGGGAYGDGSNITIKDGNVKAVGGETSYGKNGGAGIGGGAFGAGSDITINGGDVEAIGGNGGAGIGGGRGYGYSEKGSDITITDGNVIARGGEGAAGIGGGLGSDGFDITIGGGNVEAEGGAWAAGIGASSGGNGYNITISGDAQVKASGGERSDGGSATAISGTPNTANLTTGSIGYYAPGADKSQDAPEKLLHNGGSGAHTHTGVTLKSSTAATCLNNATVTYLCSCGTEITTELLNTALGHKLGAYTSNNDATCMADGTKTAHCTNPGCAYYVTTTDVGTRNPDKHSFTNYVSNNDATCSDAGHKTASCDNGCGATDVKIDENAPALGHTWGTYESNGNATCEQDGTKTAKCVRYGQGGCTATDTITDVGSKLNHDFEAKDYVSNGDATCEQDGTKTAKCVRYGQGGCTATDTVPDTGSKLGHDFTDYIYNDNASYTEDGTETAHCNHAGCNETHTRKAEGTRWALFQVTDERGWRVPYTESRNGSVLTITVNQSVATLSGTVAGLSVLQASGITTVIFKTTEAESTFHIADLLSGTRYNLTHENTAVAFTLDGNDIAALLK